MLRLSTPSTAPCAVTSGRTTSDTLRGVAASQRKHLHIGTRVGVAIATVIAVAIVVSRIDFRRPLERARISILSGESAGNHYAIVEHLKKAAAAQHGRVQNLESLGSIENVQRLGSAAAKCKTQFALVQDGVPIPETPPLELVARLPGGEAALLLGPKAGAIHELTDLAHLRIGSGPEGSGTALVAHAIFDSPEFKPLGVTLSPHPMTEQLDLVAKGQLDLAFFVIDAHAPVIENAIRERGFQIAGLPHAEAIATRLPHLGATTLVAGLYDPVRVLPAADTTVLRVETLVLGNGCATRSQTIALLDLLSHEFPDLIRYNRETPNDTGVTLADPAKSYFDHQGPELADRYAPWLVDYMAPGNWAWVVMGVSVLFNLMAFGNRYQLYRIDAARVRIERELLAQIGGSTTIGELDRLRPDERMRAPAMRDAICKTLADLDALHARSHHDSQSIVVPMGAEMAYRYQENLIEQTTAILHGLLQRCEAGERAAQA